MQWPLFIFAAIFVFMCQHNPPTPIHISLFSLTFWLYQHFFQSLLKMFAKLQLNDVERKRSIDKSVADSRGALSHPNIIVCVRVYLTILSSAIICTLRIDCSYLLSSIRLIIHIVKYFIQYGKYRTGYHYRWHIQWLFAFDYRALCGLCFYFWLSIAFRSATGTTYKSHLVSSLSSSTFGLHWFFFRTKQRICSKLNSASP